MTVREAWSQLISEVPSGATCHIARHGGPLMMHQGTSYIPDNRGTTGWLSVTIGYIGPDIAERPAAWYLGFFGDEYDRLVSHSDSSTFDPIMPEVREVVSKYLAETNESELGAAVKALMVQAINADALVRVLVSDEAKRRAAAQGDS